MLKYYSMDPSYPYFLAFSSSLLSPLHSASAPSSSVELSHRQDSERFVGMGSEPTLFSEMHSLLNVYV